EFVQELAVVDRGVHFVAELVQGVLGGLLQFRCAQAQQGGLVGRCDKLEVDGHGSPFGHFILRLSGAGGGLAAIWRGVSAGAVMRRSEMLVVESPRAFLMLSMPRVTIPRLLQYISAVSSVMMFFLKDSRQE